MPEHTQSALTSHIERARKVLQHEQRTNHQDQAVQPSGLESFVARWLESARPLCQEAGLSLYAMRDFAERLQDYRNQDPLQRAANIRTALSILSDLEGEREQPPVSLTTRPPTQASRPPRISGPTRTTSTTPARPALPASSRPGRESQITSKPTPRATPAAPSLKRAAPDKSEQNAVRLEAGMSQGHTALTLLSASITAVPHVGETTATRLRALGIHSVQDLLFYFPRDHRDYSKLASIADIPLNEVVTTTGQIWEVKTSRTSNGRTRTIATISDKSGKMNVSWFNQSFLQKQLLAAKGEYIVVTGVKQRFGNKVEFSARSYELPERGDLLNTGILVPIYPLTEGVNAKALRRHTRWVVDHYASLVPEHLPAAIRESGQLLPLATAIAQIHYPANEEELEAARRRLAFDEIFLIQLGMQERRSRWQHEAPKGQAFSIDLGKIFSKLEPGESPTAPEEATAAAEPALTGGTLWAALAPEQPFEATLPFSFTNAQTRVIREILGDLGRSQPMSRLLQGDVGAGKTAVATAAIFMAALNGYQSTIMAPTELLAEQHARGISAMLDPFGIRTVLLTGSLRARERSMGRSALESGQALVAIGTHALIQDDVFFRRLGLVIIDEQHRFGVEQRDALRKKGDHPHMLVMTATPIPRTLALTFYGDLDVSAIDQLPPGRQKIITRWRMGARRTEAYTIIEEQVAEGHQAFIICPLVEESETLAVKSVIAEYERLRTEVFPHLRLGLLHGSLKPAEKDATMRRFRDHELDILIATSVIEVGIDIPNATVMVIEDADRFGLSQLHQFRGRVGRGQHQSYCYVLSADASLTSQERLEVFQSTSDGFKLAEHDLRLRGPGDFIGVRQSGMPELHVADLSDTVLIELARTLAARLWSQDPYLRRPEHTALLQRMQRFWQDFMAH